MELLIGSLAVVLVGVGWILKAGFERYSQGLADLQSKVNAIEQWTTTEAAAGYGREKGKNLATREDFDQLLVQQRRTEEALQGVRHDLAGGLWLDQERWKFRVNDVYVPILEHFQALDSLALRAKVTTRDPEARMLTFSRSALDREAGDSEKQLRARALAALVLRPKVLRVIDQLRTLHRENGFKAEHWTDAGYEGRALLIALVKDHLTQLLRRDLVAFSGEEQARLTRLDDLSDELNRLGEEFRKDGLTPERRAELEREQQNVLLQWFETARIQGEVVPPE